MGDYIEDGLIARAAKLGTASLHEAAGRRGALPPWLKPLSPRMRAAGRAFPVRSPCGDNLWIHRALTQIEPGDVMVVDGGDGAGFGYWGEIMATAAMMRRVAALVITGGVRDSLRLIELGLPTFAAGIAIQGTIKNQAGDGAIGEPVRVGEIVVRAGDLIVGDADGVFCLPRADAPGVVTLAEERDAAEHHILRRLKAGESTLDIYNLGNKQAL